jgi:hypothetical protein
MVLLLLLLLGPLLAGVQMSSLLRRKRQQVICRTVLFCLLHAFHGTFDGADGQYRHFMSLCCSCKTLRSSAGKPRTVQPIFLGVMQV